ncbi:ABC transporter permease [Haloplanus aerogenes]|uniref:Iron ABC transporter permease n=1 Tax=Haloplanus aerogenes TaxID=660522 RepID=A0A3M0CUU9_9EURY|nr:iron ABC transporter permease [Haloplanus aerogenes]AZH26596.1 iron ABC transporter permease [Haloplanus aerogenes]RMB12827.1 iron(III) transport system permease protein [Haloplanus aerogenes]
MSREGSDIVAAVDGLRERIGWPGRYESHPLVTAAAILVAVTVISPLLWLGLRAAAVGPSEALSILTAPSTVQVFTNSLALVASVTALSVALGVPLAVLTVLTDLPFRRFWTVVLALPLVVPSYLGAFAFVSAFGPHGTLAELLSPLGVTIPTIYGFQGATLVLALFVYPYVFLTTRASLLSFDSKQLEAAQTLNHDFRSAFRRIVLPQIAPGVTAGALLVAFYALSDFGTPAIMHFDTFTRVIYVQYNNFGRGTASLLSIQLLAVTALVLFLESRFGSGTGSGYGGGVTKTDSTVTSLGWAKAPALLFCTAVVALTLVVPVAIFGMWLLRSGPGYAGGGFAFEWSFAINSVYVAAIAAAATGLAALPIAYVSARSNSPLARLLDRSTYVGYAVPGIVLGLALVFLGANYLPWLYQTLPLLVFAYVVRFLPQAVGATHSSVLQVDSELLGAARTLGETPQGAFRRVTLPLIAPGLVAGAALVFLTTMKELPATLILHPTGFTTLVTYIWRVQEAGYYGRAALPALVLVAVSALSMILLLRQEGDNA